MKYTDHHLYWDALPPLDPEEADGAVVGPYFRVFKMRDALFTPIRNLVFQALGPAVGLDGDAADPSVRAEIRDALNATTSISVDYDMALMTRLDVALHRALSHYGLLAGAKGIEFPVNLRVAHGAPPPGYLDGGYATDFIHCDPWTQGPSDIVNCLLYIDFGETSSPMDLYRVDDDGLRRMAEHDGGYLDARPLLTDLTKVEYDAGPGTFILFDAFSPHATHRSGGEIRISIDFRLRREDPYAVLDDKWLMRNVSWAKYWKLNDRLTEDYEQRCADEFAQLEGNPTAGEFRRRALGRV